MLGCRSVDYALGRYFTTVDPRHGKAPLTSAVLKLKNDDTPASVLGQAVGYAVGQLPKKPRYIVTVPHKPSQQRNRFTKLLKAAEPLLPKGVEIGRASCRERVCQDVLVSVVAGSLKKKNIK